MISSLFYLTASIPDIMLSVYLCARYQENLKESYLLVAKHIMRYLVVAQHLGLWYPKSNTCNLIGYLDANFVNSWINNKKKVPLEDVNLLVTP